jgi:thioredoxin 1
MKITSEEFPNFVASEKRVIVDFYADWCNPCKAMEPMLMEINDKHPGKVAKINVDENSELASSFGIRSIPTVLVFQNGVVVERKIGMITKETLEELLS